MRAVPPGGSPGRVVRVRQVVPLAFRILDPVREVAHFVGAQDVLLGLAGLLVGRVGRVVRRVGRLHLRIVGPFDGRRLCAAHSPWEIPQPRQESRGGTSRSSTASTSRRWVRRRGRALVAANPELRYRRADGSESGPRYRPRQAQLVRLRQSDSLERTQVRGRAAAGNRQLDADSLSWAYSQPDPFPVYRFYLPIPGLKPGRCWARERLGLRARLQTDFPSRKRVVGRLLRKVDEGLL